MTMAVQPIDSGCARLLAGLLEQRTGQRIAPNRSWRLDTALKPLLAGLAIHDVDDLARRLREGRDEVLADKVVDLLLNQETSFFRDAGVIESAAQAVAVPLAAGMPVHIWCAACATGQEALSLAMLFAERKAAERWPRMPEIIGTDVSAAAIARARQGSYSQFEIQRGLPVRRMMEWFAPDGDGQWGATPALLNTVTYRRHNLVAEPPPAGRYDLILCRNVLFYLVPRLREQVLERLAGALKPGGLLLLGAVETVIGLSDRLRPSRRLRGFYEATGCPSTAPGGAAEVAREAQSS